MQISFDIFDFYCFYGFDHGNFNHSNEDGPTGTSVMTVFCGTNDFHYQSGVRYRVGYVFFILRFALVFSLRCFKPSGNAPYLFYQLGKGFASICFFSEFECVVQDVNVSSALLEGK